MPRADLPAPEGLPKEFSAYEQKVRQLPVGEVGKSGSIRMEFEADPRTGKTTASELFSRVPLQVQKALYLEDSFPQMAYVYVMSPSGGVLQGDRLSIDISLEKGSRVHVTTQAATKVYSMNRNYATQVVNAVVGEGCYLELIPDQLIPYRNSRFHQCVSMRVHDDATMVYSEIVTPGRTGRGERFEYDICSLKTIGLDQASRVRFLDAMLLEPKRYSPLHLLDPERLVFASLYIITRSLDPKSLSDTIYDILQEGPASGGASVLPGHDGVFARMIGGTADELKRAINSVVGRVRHDILGKRFTGTRKY
jgi:urease accessory protein